MFNAVRSFFVLGLLAQRTLGLRFLPHDEGARYSGRMRHPLALLLLLLGAGSPAPADPGAFAQLNSWAQAAGAPIPAAARSAQVPPAAPVPNPDPPTQTIDLQGLVDKPWTSADSFTDAAGRTSVSAMLDLDKNGWLVIVPPGGSALLLKMGLGMSGRWTAQGRTYSADLLPNIISKNDSLLRVIGPGGNVAWQKSIADLFAVVDKTGRSVAIGGNTYQLFVSHLPDGGSSPAAPSKKIGLAFVSDKGVGADRYQFFLFSADELAGNAPKYVALLDGVKVYAKLAPDLSALDIAR